MTEGLIALALLMAFAYIGAMIDARANYAHTHIGYAVSTDEIVWTHRLGSPRPQDTP